MWIQTFGQEHKTFSRVWVTDPLQKAAFTNNWLSLQVVKTSSPTVPSSGDKVGERRQTQLQCSQAGAATHSGVSVSCSRKGREVPCCD